MAEVRRAAIRARATFDRRVGTFTREGSDTKRSGGVRVIEGGIDVDYFAILRQRGEGALIEPWGRAQTQLGPRTT
jgi:hypothetical protein